MRPRFHANLISLPSFLVYLMFGLRPPITGVLALIIFGSTVASAGPYRGIDEASFNRLTRLGPFSTEIKGKVSLRVPTGYRIVLEDKLAEFGEVSGYPFVGDESALITVSTEKPSWHALVLLIANDPMKGIDVKQLAERPARDQMLDWQREFHESRRSQKGSTFVPSKVGAWTHSPKFDETTKTLTMGVRLESETEGQKDKICYTSFIYGPENAIVAVVAYADVEDYEKAIKESSNLNDEFTFIQPYDPTAAQEEDPLFMLKVAGGGVLGSVVVLILFRFMGIGSSKKPARKGARRPVSR